MNILILIIQSQTVSYKTFQILLYLEKFFICERYLVQLKDIASKLLCDRKIFLFRNLCCIISSINNFKYITIAQLSSQGSFRCSECDPGYSGNQTVGCRRQISNCSNGKECHKNARCIQRPESSTHECQVNSGLIFFLRELFKSCQREFQNNLF